MMRAFNLCDIRKVFFESVAAIAIYNLTAKQKLFAGSVAFFAWVVVEKSHSGYFTKLALRSLLHTFRCDAE